MRFADVILPVPFETFTYVVPPEMEGHVGEGSRVWVELGKTKHYAGVVLRMHNVAPQNVIVKPILEVLDEQPVVTASQLRFWQWVAAYYMAPLGDVYKAAFPGGMKREKKKASPLPDLRREWGFAPLRGAAATFSGCSEDPSRPVREGSSHFDFELPRLTKPQQAAYNAIWESWGYLTRQEQTTPLLHAGGVPPRPSERLRVGELCSGLRGLGGEAGQGGGSGITLLLQAVIST